jgi:cobalt/nickel transport system ATP-binding protein
MSIAVATGSLMVVGHGTRDADGIEEFWTLAEHVREAAGELPVGFGFIELAEPLVDQGLDELIARGSRDVVSVPLVLLAAGHLKNDGPAALTRARARHPEINFRMGRDLGIDPVVLEIVEERARAAGGDAVVLVGRGSSDPDATSDLYKVARLLQDNRGLGMVEPAFAGVATPTVSEALERCRRLGANKIAVVPFFLFTGVLVPRIYAEAAAYAEQHPELEVMAGAHLGPDRRLARLVLERYREALTGDVRMNCDLCTYRVRLPGYEDKLGTPISLTPHGDGPARGSRRSRRATRAPAKLPPLRPAVVQTGEAILQTSELSYAYPDGTAALSGVSLSIRAGERVALLGPNGAGKTTLALAAAGALEDLQGTVTLGETTLSHATRKEVRRRVGIVFQDADDQLFMPTVEEDVAFGPANQGLSGGSLAGARVARRERRDPRAGPSPSGVRLIGVPSLSS